MRYKFIVPLFGSGIWLFVGDEEKERYTKDCKKIFGEEINLGSCDGNCCGSYIWIRDASLQVLSHEISHFVDMCLDHVGVDDKSGEVRAYILGWAVETIWRKINKGGDGMSGGKKVKPKDGGKKK